MKIILSIKPEFVSEIFSGRKRYEYRKTLFTKKVDSVIIYSTMPVGKFVGEFRIESIEIGEPTYIWEKTQKFSGISKSFFDEYFEGKTRGYALEVADITKYKTPINPFDVIKSFIAPQSFRYVTDEEFETWSWEELAF